MCGKRVVDECLTEIDFVSALARLSATTADVPKDEIARGNCRLHHRPSGLWSAPVDHLSTT